MCHRDDGRRERFDAVEDPAADVRAAADAAYTAMAALGRAAAAVAGFGRDVARLHRAAALMREARAKAVEAERLVREFALGVPS